MARKQAEEALANALQADKAKAVDLRTAYQHHQDEVHRIKRDCERDIRRVVSGCRCLRPLLGGDHNKEVEDSTPTRLCCAAFHNSCSV